MEYKKIPYTSFMWKLGTTSFRTKEFNYKTERQLALLDAFWKDPENASQGWEKKYMAPGQNDIYEIKVRYYDYLVDNGFMEGGEPWSRKYKTAREKTSGLYDMGLINENHRLTEAGRYLLELSTSLRYNEKTPIGISMDSMLYLEQLLKLSQKINGQTVRPLIVILYLLSRLDYLSHNEFCYLMPLCTDWHSTEHIISLTHRLRNREVTINQVITEVMMSKSNYAEGLRRFANMPFSEEMLLSVSMNRKSAAYDRSYVTLYKEMHSVYMEGDTSRIIPMFDSLKKFQQSISIKWKTMLFKSPVAARVKNNPEGNLRPLPVSATYTEKDFKAFFFVTMHLFKAKATLEDYQDLNKRYLGLTNCFIFDDKQVKLDIVPKHLFASSIDELYIQAYRKCHLLERKTSLAEICETLIFNEKDIIDGVSSELGTDIQTIEEAFDEVDKIRYDRFNKMIDTHFQNNTLLTLLDAFDKRNDANINRIVTDNADVPTIFEYVLGIIWYKVSGRRGKILDYLKLSLDANLLPVTHAAGGEADIVWEYPAVPAYPGHSLLLEATLTDKTNQRRMEMEPVSRHLGNHLLRTGNTNSYCVFVTTNLNVNVISDFMNRKNSLYCCPTNPDKYVEGMKIIPLSTRDLKEIIRQGIRYEDLYRHFETAYEANERHPQKWYDNYVCITGTDQAAISMKP